MLHFNRILSKKNINYKSLGSILLAGIISQIVLFFKNSYHSFNILSGILFLLVLWYFFTFVFRKKSNKIKLIIHSVFLALIGCELLLRLIGITANYMEERRGFYESMYTMTNPNWWIHRDIKTLQIANQEYSFKRNLNSLGYSDKAWEWEAMKDKTRILALGDSFTEGDGAHADSTWVKFIERKTNTTDYYFMNAGICGSDPVFELYKLKNSLKEYHPNLAIVCINHSDIQDIIIRGGHERFTNNGVEFKKGPWWEPIYAMSHISRLFFHLKYNRLLIPRKNEDKEIKNAIKTIENTINKLNNYSSSDSIIPVFVFHPQKFEVKHNENPFESLIEKQKEKGYYVIDLYDYYQTPEIKKNIDSYYWINDGHHNAKGYELMANGIYKGLIEIGIFHKYSPETNLKKNHN